MTAGARHRALVIGAIAAALLGSGCGADGAAPPAPPPATSATPGSSGPTPGTPPGSGPAGTTTTIVETLGVKACALLTDQQVAPALGFRPVVVSGSTPSFLGGGYSSVCDFRHEGDPDRQGKTVRIFVFPPGTEVENARRALEEAHDVAGLEVPAFAGRAPEESGSGPNTIIVDPGGQAFSITVVNGANRTDADLLALAAPALAAFQAARAAAPPSSTP